MKLNIGFSEVKGNWRNFLRGRRLPFKLGVIVTLAIAIGANIAVLGNLGVCFGPAVPGATHRQLYEPWLQTMRFKSEQTTSMEAFAGVSRPVYMALADQLKGLAETAIYKIERAPMNVGSGVPQQLYYLNVTPSIAHVLGVHVIAGRMLDAADSLPGAAPVTLISANLARTLFGSARAALGRIIKIKGQSREVVGVLPTKLAFPSGNLSLGFDFEAWLPFPPETTAALSDFDYYGTHALVYPSHGTSRAQLQAAFAAAYQRALQQYAASTREHMQNMQLRLRISTLATREYGPLLTRLQLLELAAVQLLLLVLANLGGLATADVLARRHELATRVALGANLWQLFRERARELLTLGFVGWLIGIGLGWLGSRALTATVGQAGEAAVFSVPVLLMTLGAVVVIALLLALGGLRRLRASGALFTDIAAGDRATGGRSMVRTLRALVVVQLVASLVLLVLSADLQTNVLQLMRNNLGFTPAGRTFFTVRLPGSEGDQTEAQYLAYAKRARIFDQSFLRRASVLPGVAHVAMLQAAPFANDSNTRDVNTTQSSNAPTQTINIQTVSREIVPALGLRVLAGDPDVVFSNSGSDVLLDRSAVQGLWPRIGTAQAIGRSLYMDGKVWRVGAVVAPLRMRPYGSIGGTVFSPLQHSDAFGGPQGFVVQSALPTKILRQELTSAVRALDPQAELGEYQPAPELIRQAYAGRNHLAHVFSVLALVTLVIATVGLFALLAYRALVRRPEFAIRSALGATSARLFRSVLVEAALLWIISCVIGLPLAWAFSRMLAAQLPELGSLAPWLAAAVAVALGVAAVIAALVPALRASRFELSTSLK